MTVLIASASMKRDRSERTKAEDFDADEGELLKEENEQEEEVFISECRGTLIKTFKASFLPFFDELSAYVTPMLGKDKTAEERRIAICIFDDIAEQCRESALKYYDTYRKERTLYKNILSPFLVPHYYVLTRVSGCVCLGFWGLSTEKSTQNETNTLRWLQAFAEACPFPSQSKKHVRTCFLLLPAALPLEIEQHKSTCPYSNSQLLHASARRTIATQTMIVNR